MSPAPAPPPQPEAHIVDVPNGAAATNYSIVTGRRFMMRLVFKLLFPLAAIKLQSPALTSDYSVQVCSLVAAGFVYCVLIEIVANTNPDGSPDQSPNKEYLEIVLHLCLITASISLVTMLLPPNQTLFVFVPLISVSVPLMVVVWFRTGIVYIFNNSFAYVMYMLTSTGDNSTPVPRVSA